MQDTTRRKLFSLSRTAKKGLRALGIGYLLPLREWHVLLKQKLKSDHTFIDGHEIFLDEQDSLDLSIDDSYDAFERNLLKQYVHEGYRVIDLGANIGLYTLTLARLVGESGRVYAFEPDPTNFSLLSRNVEVNAYRNVILERKAVSDRTGSTRLFRCPENAGDHRIVDSAEGRRLGRDRNDLARRLLPNEPSPYRSYQNGHTRRRGGALKGMMELLDRSPSLRILMEFWPAGLERFGTAPLELLETLRAKGFQISQIDRRRERLAQVGDLSAFLDSPRLRSGKHANLLCLR